MTRGTLVVRAVAVVLVGIGLGLLTASPTSAHSRLVSTDPADGSVLSTSPASITFTFDEPLLDGMDTISINDENGGLVASSPVTPQGTSITLPVETPLADGTYQAAYRVVSADGHAVMGAITFTVAAGASGSAPASTAPGVPSETTPSSAAPSAVATATPAPATPSSGGAVWLLWVGIAIVVVAIAAGVAIALRRGR